MNNRSLVAVAILALLVISPTLVAMQECDAKATAIHYRQDGVVRITLDGPLGDTHWGAEIWDSEGGLYWHSEYVADGGSEEVFLKDITTRLLYDIPSGEYIVDLYPRSGAFDEITAVMTVVDAPSEDDGNVMLTVALAVILVAAIGCVAFLIIRRRNA